MRVYYLRLFLTRSSDIPTKIVYAFIIAQMRATRLTYLILINSFAVILYCEEYEWWNFPLGSSPFPPVIGSLVYGNISS
jgi:hypothetical protein